MISDSTYLKVFELKQSRKCISKNTRRLACNEPHIYHDYAPAVAHINHTVRYILPTRQLWVHC